MSTSGSKIDGRKASKIANVILRVLDAAEEQGAMHDDIQGAVVMTVIAWAATEGWSKEQLLEVLTKDIEANFDAMKARLRVESGVLS